MAERTYGVMGWTIEDCEQSYSVLARDMAAHIRELQAENAKLKAERREFGMRVAKATDNYSCESSFLPKYALERIVEQEMNK